MERVTGREIEIKKMIDVIKKRLWVIILFVVSAVILAGIYNQLNKPIPIYESTTRLLIQENTDHFDTLLVFLTEPPILEEVKNELQLSQSIQALNNQIQIGRVDNSRIVTITVQDRSQEQATIIANTLSNVYQREVASTLDYHNIDVFSEAVVSENPVPVNPQTNNLIRIAAIAGFILGIGFVFLLDSLDNRLRSSREVERILEVPVLGTVSVMNKKTLSKKSTKKSNSSLRGETIGS
ncbi:YveK family protein [Alkalihalobacillus trypoxylicola]|uniref:Polysaccharide chain length determinant N-terminal domain-containing protein n=1 Tax=Alkalihalobacillus trypoxylicola TaxID=519424 RepID=A0A161QFL6_9BACI|nr:Wzz/FepE/Etk N-terminal domain-containing protein [Alkalihalobacillus trypoxylicola]KYG27669.1 hypothetical protein AZF04_10790 [Alkalihalobacillus trypoxylicola]